MLFSRAIFWLPPSTTTSSPRSVVVPTQPRLALLTAALSLSAIPVMYALGGNISLLPVEFFFILIFPYLVVLIMACAGSRVVYDLGAAVTKARALRAKEWWDENRPASPAGTAEPVAV